MAKGHFMGQHDPAPAPVIMDETQFSLIAEAFVKLQNAVDDLTAKMEVVLPYLDKLDDKISRPIDPGPQQTGPKPAEPGEA